MREHYDEIRKLGAEVAVVTLSRPVVVQAYQKQHAWPFPVFCDPDRAAYRYFGLARASWASFLRPAVLAGYLRLIFRGWKPRKPNAGEDPFQLGGDFVLDENQKVIFAYPSRVATDRPALALLLEMLK